MPTGTVKWINENRGRGLIAPDDGSEDLIADFSGTLMSRSKTPKEGQRVRFVITDGPEGKEASEIEHHSLIGNLLPYIHECVIDGPEPIERTLYLDSEPVAVAYLDELATEATLAWPLWSEVSVPAVLDCYLTDFLPQYRPQSSEHVLQFWIGNQYYEMTFGSELNTSLILESIEGKLSQDQSPLALLQIASERVTMELLFDESAESPVRLALVVSAAPFEPLVRLFSRFHRNEVFRNNLEVAAFAFVADSQTYGGSSKNLLYPLVMFREENNNAQLEGLSGS